MRSELEIAPTSILCHGLSIGGAIAAEVARCNPGIHLCLDQTFVNAAEVAESVAATQFDGYAPSWAVSGLVASAFPHGLQQGPHVTDGYNERPTLTQFHLEKAGALAFQGKAGRFNIRKAPNA